MLYIKKDNTSIKPMSLNDFCQKCESIGSINTIEDYQKVLPLLRSLAANRDLLIDFYETELNDIELFKQKQKLSPQTLALADLNNCEIRMVFWPAFKGTKTKKALESFAYTIPHDHNFHFASICYQGPGYLTNMYTYKREGLKVYINEPVSIKSLGQFNLEKGDVMIYERSSDIHTQIPPNELSITINIIPKQSFNDYQLYFDLNPSRIREVVEQSSQLKYLEKLTSCFNSSKVNKIFGKLSNSYPVQPD